MKRVLCLLLSFGLLSGCASRHEASVSVVPKKKEEGRESVWLREPSFTYDSLKPLAPEEHGLLSVDTQAFGSVTVSVDTEASGYPAQLSGYSPAILIAETNGSQGIIGYNGNQLLAPDLSMMGSPFQQGLIAGIYNKETAYGITDTASGKTKILSREGTSVSEVSAGDFITTVSGDGSAQPYLAVQNNTPGICAMTKDAAGNNTGWAFEAIDPAVLKGRTVLTQINDSCNPVTSVIYNPADGSVIRLADGYRKGSFANGYYITTGSRHATLVEAGSAQGVAVGYDDAKYMTDGYCPMERSGKWGLVDGTGKEVTDFIFDDLTPLYEGRAFASINGQYGILDVRNLLSSGKQINMDTVTVGKKEKASGQASVKVSALVIRNEPNTDSAVLGVSCAGSLYNVYETSSDGTYTWYRIAPDAWVADQNGEWIDYQEK